MRFFLYLFSFLSLVSCASTTDQGSIGVNRRQFLSGISEEEVLKQSEKTYHQMKVQAQRKDLLDKNPKAYKRVSQIADKLIKQTQVFRSDSINWNWEYHIISSEELNAFCLPGGKIMIYSNLIDSLQLTDNEIAVVLGHEIAHALREHGREKMAQQSITKGSTRAGLALLVATGMMGSSYVNSAQKQAKSFTDVLISLPHNRTQEFEADAVGIELMARAGYNPEEALKLWKKIAAQSEDKSLTLLSTHPAENDRFEYIQSLLPKVRPLYEATIKNH